jgi:lipoxygenase homology domain-containing protein 1
VAQVDRPTRYKLTIKTGGIKDAGTRARVHAVIKGERGSTGHVDLVQSNSSNVPFQIGCSDSFDIITDFNLGELQSLEIGHDNSGKNPEWFVESATVIDDAINSKWTFMAFRWLARQQCAVELQPTAGSPCPYTICVFTANTPDSGTSSAVTITLTGATSQSQEMQLTASREHEFPFQRGYCDTFEVRPGTYHIYCVLHCPSHEAAVVQVISCREVGAVKAVQIRCDGIGRFPGLTVEKVVVRSGIDGSKYTFLGPRRVEAPKFEVLIEAVAAAAVVYSVTITPATEEWDDASWVRSVSLNLLGSDGESGSCSLQKLPSLPSSAGGRKSYTYRLSSGVDIGELVLGRFALKVEDGKFQSSFDMRRVIITNVASSQRWLLSIPAALATASPFIECRIETRIAYRLTVKTSSAFASACDHNVFVRLTGDAGDSGELQLLNPRSGRRPFQQGASDDFDLIVPQLLGGLKLLRVGHDNSGAAAGWGLESVQVLDTDTLETWLFQVGTFVELVVSTLAIQSPTDSFVQQVPVHLCRRRGHASEALLFQAQACHGRVCRCCHAQG